MQMVKKLKEIADAGTDNQLASTIKDSAQQIWLAGLGAFVKAQEEGSKLFEALVKEGEALQAKTRKAAEDRVVAFTGKATDTWDKLEKVFEDRVARAIHSLGVPTKQDVQALSRRVAELTEAVQKLSETEEQAAKRRVPAAK
jgi:poly(hydroxyalkanoate) granule-associated protein